MIAFPPSALLGRRATLLVVVLFAANPGCGSCTCVPALGLDAAGFADGTTPGTDAIPPGTDAGAIDSGLATDAAATGGGLRTIFTGPPAGISPFWVELAPFAGEGYAALSGCWGRSIEAAGTGDVTTTLALAGDDDAAAVTLPFPFPFFDIPETQAFVSANGHLTFGAPDLGTTVSLAAHDAFRRISPLMSDLAGGTIVVDEFADHVNVHWMGWGDGTTPAVDIHLSLGADGVILYLWTGEPNVYPFIIGISDGLGAGQDVGVFWPLC